MNDLAWRCVLAAVGGILAAACGSSTPDAGAPAGAPGDTGAPAADEKNPCASGEPHHCASEGGKHVCGADHHPPPLSTSSPGPVAVDAGAPSGDAGTAAVDGGTVDAGAAKGGHTHTHSDGKPHKH
jgi:hypothetical protein